MVRDERGDKEAGGVVLKKKWGTPKTTLRQKFLHCVSVSNQLQQWTNFCTNFSPKSGGMADASPLSKKVGTPSPPPLHRWEEAAGAGAAAATVKSKEVKFSHTRYRALGPELIPVYRQSARR